MTAKELRKLSRLELLELLLESAKENEKLKEKVLHLEAENEAAHSIDNLHDASCRLELTLASASRLTESLRQTAKDVAAAGNAANAPAEIPSFATGQQAMSDKTLYCRLLNFFAKNRDMLHILPADLRQDVSVRINQLLGRAKQK